MRALLLFSKLSSNFFHAFSAVGSPSINFTYASSVWISISPFAWLDTFFPSMDSGSSSAHSHPLYARSPRNLAFHVGQSSPHNCGIDTLSPAISTTLLYTLGSQILRSFSSQAHRREHSNSGPTDSQN